MAEKRGKESEDDPTPADPSASDVELARGRIRQRWEFASVLNFLHVFKPVIGSDLKISAEEIETALITPNRDLASLHVALLKGIPPVNKKMTEADTWVTVVCRKLVTWWPWVAEGDNPLKVDHGKEIQRYKLLDPVTRMGILKAICEVRAQQDDILSYITDELKKGTELATFRKERIGGAGNGVSYWYDGDPVIGYRLYKEVVQVDSRRKAKGKGGAPQPTNNYQWETVATEFGEFKEISEKLSSSNISVEASVGEIIKTEIIPILAKLQQKKERAWKRQQREALQLNDFLNYSRVGVTRSCRERPVRYTFDEYDRSIDEAIQISKKSKTTGSEKENGRRTRGSANEVTLDGNKKLGEENSEADDEMHENPADDEEDKYQSDKDENDHSDEKYNKYKSDNNDDDDDYDEKDEHDNDSNVEEEEEEEEAEEEEEEEEEEEGDFVSSDEENDDSPKQTINQNNARTKAAVGVRRSQRFTEISEGPAETKKRLRQRPTRNSAQMVSDSEDSSPKNEKQTEIVSDSEMADSAGDGSAGAGDDESTGDDGSPDSGDASE
ncbi:uncharacterized protein A4U43_C01F21950 [Asparagus officinalis]|uniref:DDT domain-containing protein n=1 Tax=Asparagus officinalis TaxID=4686 RepID=A0A5P1FR66_ASPOF|nr:DDT domain-containing protein DDR4-like [Asparagus officinalis]ONK80805.1 uncharacterized protein A4U43_C01F21950 [Asparagus officinalis]